MHLFFKRLALYLIAPMAVVALLLPISTHSLEYTERAFIFAIPVDAPPPSEAVITADDIKNCPRLVRSLRLCLEAPPLSDVLGDSDQVKPWRLSRVPEREWDRLKSQTDAAGPVFVRYPERTFRLFLQPDSSLEKVRIPYLDIGRRLTGALLAILTILVGQSLYRRRKRGGISIGQPNLIFLRDLLIMAFMVIFAYGLTDLVLHTGFNTQTLTRADELHFLGIIGYVVFAPFMAMFISATSAQIIFINPDGVLSDSLAGRRKMAWADVVDMHIREVYTFQRVDFYYPKQLTRILEIVGPFRRLRIMEPPQPKKKRLIMQQMAENAPPAMRSKIKQLEAEWTEGSPR